MEYKERKIAKVYAIVTLYTIILLTGGILLGFAMGRQSVGLPSGTLWASENEEGYFNFDEAVEALDIWLDMVNEKKE